MAQRQRDHQISLSALWRNPTIRAVIYQIVILGAVALAAYTIFQNTRENLERQGIVSGFSFLGNEAGFGIAEILPVPQLEGGFLYLLIALGVGLVLIFLFLQWRKRWADSAESDIRISLLVIGLLVAVPVVVLYFTGDTIRSIRYTEANSYGVALIVGLLNTLKVSLLGCIFATILGLFIGIARLSSNWLVAKLAETYVEILRNIPLLVQLFFVYYAVLQTMPGPRQSLRPFQGLNDLLVSVFHTVIPGGGAPGQVNWISDILVINNRGLFLPGPVSQPSSGLFAVSIMVVLMGIYFWARYVRLRQDLTGEQLPVLWPSLAGLVIVPGLVWLIFGGPFTPEFPEMQGFNFKGGLELSPEFAALLLGLSLYTASFIAEIVRSGIQAVSKGQREAAQSLGLRGGQTLRLVVLPQAMRVIIPPLTSQYLNLTKNSSLGGAIGFAEVVNVGGTINNQSGQAIEVIFLTMLIYLSFSLSISFFMNWYNARMRMEER